MILLFVALTMLNCKNKEQKETDYNSTSQEVTVEKTNPSIELGCYVFNDTKNQVSLEIIENAKENKGNLTYALAEKDKNSGHFTGSLKDGILIAAYTFQSEGMESTREVAFKINGDTLTEGYGELNEDGTAFKDRSSLSFTSKMPLLKTDCE